MGKQTKRKQTKRKQTKSIGSGSPKTKKNKNNSKPDNKKSQSQLFDESCCMCENNKVDKINPLIPLKCFRKYGKIRAHKICSDCWWNKFAKEHESHECPGCEKKIPIAKDPNAGIIIDLTEDSK